MTWRRLAWRWSAFGLVACLFLGLLSYVPSVPAVPFPLLLACVAGIFPTMATVILLGRKDGEEPPDAPDARRWPFKGDVWVGLALPVAVVGFLSAMATLHGQPEIHDGRYYLDSHGTLTQTTLAGYHDALRAVQRIFTSIPAVFFAIAYLNLRPRRVVTAPLTDRG